MDFSICCFNCKENYIIDVLNTKIEGPVIRTQCPFCSKRTERNFSKFTETQINGNTTGFCERARKMIEFARFTEKELVGDR
jgi:hypothetical protein